MILRMLRHSCRLARLGLAFVLMVGCAGEDASSTSPIEVASVAISPPSGSVEVGATTQLSATTKDASGNELTGRTVTWSSSSTSIAGVSSSGLVSGVSVGSATISATSEGQTATALIIVTVVPVASVAIVPSSGSVAVGATIQLSATTKDASGNELTGRTLTWLSSSTSIARVSDSGLVSGVSVGSATISATSEGQTATAQIVVTFVPVATTSVTVTNDISFEPQHIKVAPGAAVTWTWAAGNVDHNVTFSSSSIMSSATQSSGSFTSTMPTDAGVYDYICTIHGIIMSGTVTVE